MNQYHRNYHTIEEDIPLSRIEKCAYDFLTEHLGIKEARFVRKPKTETFEFQELDSMSSGQPDLDGLTLSAIVDDPKIASSWILAKAMTCEEVRVLRERIQKIVGKKPDDIYAIFYRPVQ